MIAELRSSIRSLTVLQIAALAALIPIGFLIKPLVAFLGFFSLLRRQWRSIGVAVATLVVASLLTIVVFSPTTFFSFFTNSPTANTLAHLYTEADNQSLLGTI